VSQAFSVLTVLGTRPEIIKLSPLLSRLPEVCTRSVIVHTGQHYSYEMDAQFFEELDLPAAEYNLKAGSAGLGAGEQTGRMLGGLEIILKAEKPDLVLVQGDTNSTLAGALAAVKLNIPVLHLEAGCRSFNRAMPEEINRVMVDHVAALLLAPDEIAVKNLEAEGCQYHAKIYNVGSTGLEACTRAFNLNRPNTLLKDLGVRAGEYFALTLHRAENTTPEILPGLVQTINALAEDYPVVFPLHPRTEACLERYKLQLSEKVIPLKPLGYLDMLTLISRARAVLTDSGGLQEEAAVLGSPVLVLRQETEWRYLVTAGKAVLLGNEYPVTLERARECLAPPKYLAMREATIAPPLNISSKILEIVREYKDTVLS
jgi:UDP-N-acetylglucosamine 2-epimerase